MKRAVLAAAIVAAWAASIFAQGSEVKKTVDGTVGIQEDTQKKKEGWANEEAELLARYRTAKANVKYLEDRKTVQEKKLGALNDRIAELERRLEESDRLNASLQDTLMSLLGRLETWVTERDLPFLMEERTNRISSLRDELLRPDVESGEKLRRMLEALQVEAQYGGTVEVEQQRIEVNGEELFVDLLRLGRVSVFWRTPDGKRVGEYDRGAGAWVELPGKHKRAIGEAMEMASRMRPTEIIGLPLGRIAR